MVTRAGVSSAEFCTGIYSSRGSRHNCEHINRSPLIWLDFSGQLTPLRRECRSASAEPVCSGAPPSTHCTRDRGCSVHPAFPAPSFRGEPRSKLGQVVLRDREALFRRTMRSQTLIRRSAPRWRLSAALRNLPSRAGIAEEIGPISPCSNGRNGRLSPFIIAPNGPLALRGNGSAYTAGWEPWRRQASGWATVRRGR